MRQAQSSGQNGGKAVSGCAQTRGAGNFKEWLARIRPEHRELASWLHRLIMEAFPDFEEQIKWGNPCFTHDGAKRCYIADQSKCVHLGFYNGASLTDRSGVVEGTGKAMRHVKVTAASPELEATLKGLVVQSAGLPPSASAV